ncbi:citrate lyase holo-[acyl-carrier protein] synthase [Clostridium sp. YIM B02555]|uniref:citrate lyase holo-[acyl-carrier protein] synthase n=1 Tax=Clostridium sp. YIM B02555 TaxID=2911968 RepID=UPI001EED978A|nr:citrate lyase holo-[acyl-carrier protein] synthase [Clostridium sp. YIM B02555]
MNQYLSIIGKKILMAREERYLKKIKISKNHKCIIELSLNIPGVPKSGGIWAGVFKVCIRSIQDNIPSQLLLYNIDIAGYYAVFSSYISLKDTKIKSCLIEEQNMWGRLVDIDCFENGVKISREDVGFKERKCILCNNYNSVCIRNHVHNIKELRCEAEKLAKNIE